MISLSSLMSLCVRYELRSSDESRSIDLTVRRLAEAPNRIALSLLRWPISLSVGGVAEPLISAERT